MKQKKNNKFSKEWLKFLFPLPSIITFTFAGIILALADVNGQPMTFLYWLLYMGFLLAFFIVPFDIIYFLVKRAAKYVPHIKKPQQLHFSRHLDRQKTLSETSIDYNTQQNETLSFNDIFKYKSVVFKIEGIDYDIMQICDVEKIPNLPLTANIFGQDYSLKTVLANNAQYIFESGGNVSLANACLKKAIELSFPKFGNDEQPATLPSPAPLSFNPQTSTLKKIKPEITDNADKKSSSNDASKGNSFQQKKIISSSKEERDFEQFMIECNAILTHQDEMEQYGELNK